MRVAKAFSSISSSSWKSIARRVLPSRLELNSPEAARVAAAPRRRASRQLVRAALPADPGRADAARGRAGSRHARRAGAAPRRPRVCGEPGTAAGEQVVGVLITAAGSSRYVSSSVWLAVLRYAPALAV